MTKSELKTGMIVTRRDGKKMTVYRNCVCSFAHPSYNDVFVDASALAWSSFDSYTEDLKSKFGYAEFDIVKVELVHQPYDYNKYPDYAKVDDVLWPQDNAKKLTVAEIESILGYKVEIVSEK
jgi:hypothetical protein